jgi:hypothetical protein
MSENNEDFNSLRQLLALKRHEMPPPGYFEDFSNQIISRIKAGETKSDNRFAEKLAGEAPWLLRFLRFFEAKPGMVGGMAAALCLILLGGILYSEGNDTPTESSLMNQPAGTVATSGTAMGGDQNTSQLLASIANSGNSGGLAVTTNYSLQPVSSMFGSEPNPFTQPVSFSSGGN